MPKIDLKLVAAATLLLGLFTGFYIDNTLLTKPRINNLAQTIESQNQSINTLNTQLETLQNEYERLETQYRELYENNVPQNQYNQLMEEKQNLDTQVNNLEEQVLDLRLTVERLDTTLMDKNNTIQTLETELETLQEKYDEAYNPLSINFTVQDLNITIVVDKDTYPDNTPITGTVIINHSNGAPYTGDFKLSLTKIYVNSGTSSQYYNIHRTTDYNWNTPFILGAGSYKLTLGEIRTPQGETVVTSTQLKPYALYLFQG